MHLPAPHRDVLDELLPSMQTDPRVQAVAIGGSVADAAADEFSDLDLVVAIDDDHYDDVSAHRLELIAGWGDVVAAFTGEHVGEPRLIITLIGRTPVHVDFVFLRASDVSTYPGFRLPLWERSAAAPAAEPPGPYGTGNSRQWMEDRFWVWVHYGATKLGRGELFEALQFLGFVRETVLAPLLNRRSGLPERGLRRIESRLPGDVDALAATLALHDEEQIERAIRATVELYRELRGPAEEVVRNERAELAAMDYLDGVVRRLSEGVAPL